MNIKYVLRAYKVVPVIVNRSEEDGRSSVSDPKTPLCENWVSTTRIYDTIEACVKNNIDTIKQGIKQKEYEIELKKQEVEAMKKLLEVA